MTSTIYLDMYLDLQKLDCKLNEMQTGLYTVQFYYCRNGFKIATMDIYCTAITLSVLVKKGEKLLRDS